MNYNQTVTNWIAQLGSGNENAVEVMFEKYFDRLIRLAVRKMHGMSQVPRSGEDIAISAVKSFCLGLREQRIEIDSEDDLWACLFRITTRKACAERRRTFAQKRGGNQAALSLDSDSDDDTAVFLQVAGKEPSPELAMEMAESADELLSIFDDQPTQRRIIELKLAGFSNQEIAEETGLVIRTIFWHLKNIQAKWNFIKTIEYFIENLFSGTPLESLSETLDWPMEKVNLIIEKMLELWESENGNKGEAEVLRQKWFDPVSYRRNIEKGEPVFLQTDKISDKMADRWIARSKTAWRGSLQRLLER